MVKLSNDENIRNLKKRKILRYIIIALGFTTIILAILSLTIKLWFGFSLISFIITSILTKKRESIPIRLNKDLEIKKIEKAMAKKKR